MHALVIEDDTRTADFIVKGLKENGFAVDHAPDGADGLHLATTRPYDIMVVDRMVPGLDGLAVIQALRAARIDIPAIVLSSLGQADHRIEGLKAGSDDYLAKPFVFDELLARIAAILRRRRGGGEITRLEVGDLAMDLLSRRVVRAGRSIELLPREFQLLECLMRNAGRVVTRTMLLESVWNYHFDPNTNVIDTQISRVRQKVDRDFPAALIRTIRGSGYMIAAPDVTVA
jgi:two-component system, OmpR family, response regulator